jgi:hypothetical protein
MWRKTDDIAARFLPAAHSLTDSGAGRAAEIVSAMHRFCYANCVMPTRMIVVQMNR